MSEPSQAYLRKILDYDPVTGKLYWKQRLSNRIKIGDEAGTLNLAGYIQLRINGIIYLAHRIIYVWMKGPIPPGLEVDHRNLVRNENWWDNLRLATKAQQRMNQEMPKNNQTGFKGVSFHVPSGKYRARLGRQYIGLYTTKEEAAAAYQAEATQAFGEYART